ncbi:hypothetical protein [Iodobacter fluviatilis]|uniref:Uncharacterized protein n=1 Tax=Iodobacter fluviatilis TaxID=537 RepID=A0A7G3GFA5_9NEIS|nr:hypothetical protein [Iodobacter fluviatilis]QBC45864.1 hypothetical protein C1H71_20185 [Iodobacter fluviatilis]
MSEDAVNVLNFELLRTIPATAAAMDFSGTTLHLFGDGTAMLWDDEYPFFKYSPRLKIDELETFCLEHSARYEAFFFENEAKLDNGEIVEMSPWWNITSNGALLNG